LARIDNQARIQFGEAELVIETPFELILTDQSYQLDPNDRAGSVSSTPSISDTAVDISMSIRGELGVIFESGTRLVVPSHPKYERGRSGLHLSPGGF